MTKNAVATARLLQTMEEMCRLWRTIQSDVENRPTTLNDEFVEGIRDRVIIFNSCSRTLAMDATDALSTTPTRPQVTYQTDQGEPIYEHQVRSTRTARLGEVLVETYGKTQLVTPQNLDTIDEAALESTAKQYLAERGWKVEAPERRTAIG